MYKSFKALNYSAQLLTRNKNKQYACWTKVCSSQELDEINHHIWKEHFKISTNGRLAKFGCEML